MGIETTGIVSHIIFRRTYGRPWYLCGKNVEPRKEDACIETRFSAVIRRSGMGAGICRHPCPRVYIKSKTEKIKVRKVKLCRYIWQYPRLGYPVYQIGGEL